MAPDATLVHAVETLTATRGSRWSAQSGSALNALWRVEARRVDAGRLDAHLHHAPLAATAGVDRASTKLCVKVNARARLAMFEAEAEGLAAIAATQTVRVPRALGTGSTATQAFLVLEWLELAPASRAAALGCAVAAMHRATAERFGWHRDSTIGTTPQPNGWFDDWPAFFRERRLAPQLELARRNGHARFVRDGDRVLAAVDPLLRAHHPAASLLHGDLWCGNAAALRDGTPVLLDPAAYYGDRETDLAMTELFGGFEPAFHDAYRAQWPVAEGYPRRRTLYNLYHVLNHLNLFGASYGAQARTMLQQLAHY